MTRLVSSLPVTPLAQISNNIIHTISYETCGDPSPSSSTNTLLETRIHVYIYIYIYICPRENHDVHNRVSTCLYKLGCTHTCMRSVHVRRSLAPSLATSEPLTGEVRVLPQKKNASQRSPGASPGHTSTRPSIQRVTRMTTRAVTTQRAHDATH